MEKMGMSKFTQLVLCSICFNICFASPTFSPTQKPTTVGERDYDQPEPGPIQHQGGDFIQFPREYFWTTIPVYLGFICCFLMCVRCSWIKNGFKSHHDDPAITYGLLPRDMARLRAEGYFINDVDDERSSLMIDMDEIEDNGDVELTVQRRNKKGRGLGSSTMSPLVGSDGHEATLDVSGGSMRSLPLNDPKIADEVEDDFFQRTKHYDDHAFQIDNQNQALI